MTMSAKQSGNPIFQKALVEHKAKAYYNLKNQALHIKKSTPRSVRRSTSSRLLRTDGQSNLKSSLRVSKQLNTTQAPVEKKKRCRM